ncbi:MAG TPA: thioredoxin domain-containing protein [Terriglobales bacterium]|jgi:protein-disulfide isomerase|nr:thioredoxin domain-containing protein [Terriglobales bacterium]
MFRWFLLMMLRRAFLVLLVICLGCSAQSPSASNPTSTPAVPSDLSRLVERHVRAQYSLPPEVKVIVGSLRSSEFPNYDALTVTFASPDQKKDFEFLLSRDHKTLLRMTRLDLTQDPYSEAMKKIDVSGRPTRGNKNAKVTIVNYDDFECPFCARMHSTLFPGLFKEYGDRVLFIYKDYPLEEIHPWAVHAAVNANCLNAQNNDAYWDYADYLHGNQHAISDQKGQDARNAELDKLATLQAQKHNLDVPKLQACVKAQDEKTVRASMKEGEALGVDATPTMFVNGQKLDGAVPAEDVRLALDQALTDAGVMPPVHSPAAEDKTTPAASSK